MTAEEAYAIALAARARQSKGNIEHPNLRGYEPFSIEFEDLGHNCIQVDVNGIAPINYTESLNPDLMIEIHTNILKALKNYGDITTHSSAEIGYSFDLRELKRSSRRYNSQEAEISLTIIFKKPVMNASACSLQPTIQLITSHILAEIFIQKV